MKKQTAVEYLIQEINHDASVKSKSASKWLEVFEKARAIEREQIVDAYKADRYPCSDEDAEQYYNETYGGEQ